MKKLALVFIIAVLAPSLALAWLAIRSLRDQQFVIERQKTLLYQGVADSIAHQAQTILADYQHDFAAHVESLLRDREPVRAARTFDDELRTNWPLAEVGFVVSLRGMMIAPSPTNRPQ